MPHRWAKSQIDALQPDTVLQRITGPVSILLALAAIASVPAAHAQGLECDSFKWEQDGLNEADIESGAPKIVPLQSYSAVVGVRQTVCTPREDFCGAPAQQVALRLGQRPAFVHVQLAASSAALGTHDPGNLEATTRATYWIDAQTLAQQLFDIELIATCPSGAVIRGNATFYVGGYYAMNASLVGSSRGEELRWDVEAQNAGNTRLFVVPRINGSSASDPRWVLPARFGLDHPTRDDPDGGHARITVRWKGDAPPVDAQLVLRPHVYGAPEAMGADAYVDLPLPTQVADAAAPGLLWVAVLVGVLVCRGRRRRDS